MKLKFQENPHGGKPWWWRNHENHPLENATKFFHTPATAIELIKKCIELKKKK